MIHNNAKCVGVWISGSWIYVKAVFGCVSWIGFLFVCLFPSQIQGFRFFFSFPSVIPFHSRVQIQPKAIERIYNGVVLMFLYTDGRGIMAYGMEL